MARLHDVVVTFTNLALDTLKPIAGGEPINSVQITAVRRCASIHSGCRRRERALAVRFSELHAS
jgi:hypothetical protein